MKKALFHLQYEIEDRKAYSEQGAEQGAKLSVDDIGNEAVKHILQQTSTLSQKELPMPSGMQEFQLSVQRHREPPSKLQKIYRKYS